MLRTLVTFIIILPKRPFHRSQYPFIVRSCLKVIIVAMKVKTTVVHNKQKMLDKELLSTESREVGIATKKE